MPSKKRAISKATERQVKEAFIDGYVSACDEFHIYRVFKANNITVEEAAEKAWLKQNTTT